jgi:Xaa-Pro aminopeptidase
MDHEGRMQRALAQMLDVRLNALLVTHLPNVRYLCGFSGTAGALLLNERKSVFFTDGRYAEQARDEVHGATVKIVKGKSAIVAVAEWMARQSAVRRLGFEASHMTVAERGQVAKALGRRVKLIEAPSIIERLRMIKDAEEIARIRAACEMGVQLWKQKLNRIRGGRRESEIAGELEFGAREAGSDQMAFPTIIAGGARSALPHGRASSAPLPESGFVVCDFGVILAGYCSDMTRTVHIGRIQTELREVYKAVQEAQQAAVNRVKAGVALTEVDGAARKLLKKRKLDRFFSHSTGHGLGLEVHELPRVAAGQAELLQSEMVITIEPGVYLPNKFGVRIEDTVLVTETGCEVLTPCSKDLITV